MKEENKVIRVMNTQDYLFKKAKCSSFLKKVRDGKFIRVYKGEFDEASYCNSNDPDNEITSECCGEFDFLKTYYKKKQRNFTGFIVGVKDIVVTGYLVADTEYHPYNGEHLRIFKYPKEITKCAIVYYGNNKKSYVPLESIEVGD